MKRAPLVVGLAALVGCASILDIPRLEPPAAAVDGGIDSSEDGSCQAEGVTNLTVAPRSVHVAIDDTDVYFTHVDPPRDSAILRCSKCGCDKPTPLVEGLTQPSAIAVDERYVFWTEGADNGSLNRVDKRDRTKVQRITGLVVPVGVTVDAKYVFWTVIGGGINGDVSTAGVYRATKDDLGEVTLLAKSQDQRDNVGPYAIAVDDTHVYYTLATDLDQSNAEQPCGGESGTVRRVLKNGGLQVSEAIAKGQACPVGIALSKGDVYWLNLGAGREAFTGSLWTVPKSGGPAKRLAEKLGRPTSLALHDDRLAWTAPAGGRVEWCGAPACSEVATLAKDQPNPSTVAADRSGIYWVALGTPLTFGDGALRRAPLPPLPP